MLELILAVSLVGALGALAVVGREYVLLQRDRIRLAGRRQDFAERRYDEAKLAAPTVAEFRAMQAMVNQLREVTNAMAVATGVLGRPIEPPRAGEEAVR